MGKCLISHEQSNINFLCLLIPVKPQQLIGGITQRPQSQHCALSALTVNTWSHSWENLVLGGSKMLEVDGKCRLIRAIRALGCWERRSSGLLMPLRYDDENEGLCFA